MLQKFYKKLVRIGNGSHTLCIPKVYMDHLKLTKNSMLKLSIENNKIVIKKLEEEE